MVLKVMQGVYLFVMLFAPLLLVIIYVATPVITYTVFQGTQIVTTFNF